MFGCLAVSPNNLSPYSGEACRPQAPAGDLCQVHLRLAESLSTWPQHHDRFVNSNVGDGGSLLPIRRRANDFVGSATQPVRASSSGRSSEEGQHAPRRASTPSIPCRALVLSAVDAPQPSRILIVARPKEQCVPSVRRLQNSTPVVSQLLRVVYVVVSAERYSQA